MTIITCGQLVTSTISAQDLRDWVKDHNYSRKTLDGRKIFLCPKKYIDNLVPDGAVVLPRYIFNASAFWAEADRVLQLTADNSLGIGQVSVRVREITRDGRVVVVLANGETRFVEMEDLAKK